MSSSIVRRLIVKDLYLHRGMVIGSFVGGAVLLAVAMLGNTALWVSSVLLFATLLILNVFLVMANIQGEKKEKVQVFVLSLPVSPLQYVTAKVSSTLIAFFVPWALLTAAAVAVIAVSPIPNGVIPFTVTVSTYIVCYHCVLLAATLLSDSTAWTTLSIIVGNIVPSFLIPVMLGSPSMQTYGRSPTTVVTADVVVIFAAELAISVLALVLVFYFYSRKKDFI
jgi:ABC-2 type transport system permease protein